MAEPEPDVLGRIADAYVLFLGRVPWDHALVVAGLREGMRKFLSNAYLASFPRRRKHELTQLISADALARLKNGERGGLVFEHVVPNRWSVQEPCERLAREGSLTVAFVLDLLERYWVLATITTEEDRRLIRRGMPEAWDGRDVLARYSSVGIALIPNPHAAPGVPTNTEHGQVR